MKIASLIDIFTRLDPAKYKGSLPIYKVIKYFNSLITHGIHYIFTNKKFANTLDQLILWCQLYQAACEFYF